MHKKKKSVWKKILWLIRPYLHFLMLSFVFAGISALLTLYAPILIGNAVDLIIGKGSVDFDAIGMERPSVGSSPMWSSFRMDSSWDLLSSLPVW